jgi:hypothetical protein
MIIPILAGRWQNVKATLKGLPFLLGTSPLLRKAGIQGVAQAIAQQVERQHGNHDG